jgi:hypothetical protein
MFASIIQSGLSYRTVQRNPAYLLGREMSYNGEWLNPTSALF